MSTVAQVLSFLLLAGNACVMGAIPDEVIVPTSTATGSAIPTVDRSSCSRVHCSKTVSTGRNLIRTVVAPTVAGETQNHALNKR